MFNYFSSSLTIQQLLIFRVREKRLASRHLIGQVWTLPNTNRPCSTIADTLLALSWRGPTGKRSWLSLAAFQPAWRGGIRTTARRRWSQKISHHRAGTTGRRRWSPLTEIRSSSTTTQSVESTHRTKGSGSSISRTILGLKSEKCSRLGMTLLSCQYLVYLALKANFLYGYENFNTTFLWWYLYLISLVQMWFSQFLNVKIK